MINIENAEKLLASTRIGLNLWHPDVMGELASVVGEALQPIESFVHDLPDPQLARQYVHPVFGLIVTDRPLRTVILYIECATDNEGRVGWGKYGFELIPAQVNELPDGRRAQTPHLSIRIIHDGWRSEIVRVPLGFVCTMDHDLTSATVVYEHKYFPPVGGDPSQVSRDWTNLTYVGVTKKSWASRWREHLSSARSGSHYDFHEAIRHYEGTYHSMHTILAVCQRWEDAMKHEEDLVQRLSLRPRGLNMIPGGMAGIAFAAKYGVKVDSPKRWEQRDNIVRQIQLSAKRRGIPNPAQSLRLSNDPELMRRMVEARNDTFDANQIAIIRSMFAMGIDWRDIAKQLAVKDAYRVRNVVESRTYKFVH